MENSFFEGGIRVPYIVSWPDEIKPGQKSNSAVHHFDIFSTVTSAAGIKFKGADLDGLIFSLILRKKTLQILTKLFSGVRAIINPFCTKIGNT